MNIYLFTLYDSIFNTVFPSQVIQPIVKRLDNGEYDRAVIISFERHKPSEQKIKKLINDHRIRLIICKQLPFLGSLSLWYATYQLKKTLSSTTFTDITARGPLAGWITLHATNQRFIVQARGLAAEEYRYEKSSSRWPLSWLHQFRAWQYEQIEHQIYCQKNIQMQAVSTALRDYLIDTFKTSPCNITIATHDIPVAISAEQLLHWRLSIRKQLMIDSQSTVYLYCGSAHSWQCPEESIDFFIKKYEQDSAAFLLILTPHKHQFAVLLEQKKVPPRCYHLTCIPHQEVFHYLAAADAGLLFRKKHIINWVSRPTKALEYRAAGLKIIHNNTIAMLS